LIRSAESRKRDYSRLQNLKLRAFGLLPPAGRVILTVQSPEKGGPRDDDILPALSPAWPGQRPANAFAGLTRHSSRKIFLVCPSWPCVARFEFRARIFNPSPRFDTDVRCWLRATDVVMAGKTRERS